MEDIPVMAGAEFTCVQVWRGWGHELSVNACNGQSVGSWTLYFSTHFLGETYIKADHVDEDAGWGNYFPWGSIMVKPGCTLYMFKGEEFSGSRWELRAGQGDDDQPLHCSNVITGPAAVYDNSWGTSDWTNPPGPTSWKCRCIQEPVQCQPEDRYEVVLVCDNTLGQVTTKCSYSQTVGTQFSESVEEGMSVDTTVEAEMAAQFFGMFSGGLGVSESTGYDWSSTSEAAKSEQVTVTVEAEAPPGLVLVIEQATGSCDDSEVRTEQFRTSHHDRQGNIRHQTVFYKQ